ncbi:Hypothetical_protein [Hexamita inflata]|uniref:Hypothetical_protein n=1 Tax=Hexamita inflata TaxID=28002 RepID=A0AA86PXC3_9EUKA|nr:Hypothetical protein HINF_LOCUS30427 [Hexamita inflata]
MRGGAVLSFSETAISNVVFGPTQQNSNTTRSKIQGNGDIQQVRPLEKSPLKGAIKTKSNNNMTRIQNIFRAQIFVLLEMRRLMFHCDQVNIEQQHDAFQNWYGISARSHQPGFKRDLQTESNSNMTDPQYFQVQISSRWQNQLVIFLNVMVAGDQKCNLVRQEYSFSAFWLRITYAECDCIPAISNGALSPQTMNRV